MNDRTGFDPVISRFRKEIGKFEYFFSARGTEGGLSSTGWTIAPEGETDGETARRALGAFAAAHTELLDRLVRGLVRERPRPEMSDYSSGRVSFDWHLRSELTARGSLRVRSRLADMFGVERVHKRGELKTFSILEARIELRSGRLRNEPDPDASLTIEHRLGHAINACLFRHLRRSGELTMDAETAASMDSLEALLTVVDDSWTPTGADAIAQSERAGSGPSAAAAGRSASQP